MNSISPTTRTGERPSIPRGREAAEQFWAVPLSDVVVDEEIERAVLETVRSGWWSMGPQVKAFEDEFARRTGAKFAFAVANGTAALHLALLATKCGPGDEVLVPSLNFVAAANTIGFMAAMYHSGEGGRELIEGTIKNIRSEHLPTSDAE